MKQPLLSITATRHSSSSEKIRCILAVQNTAFEVLTLNYFRSSGNTYNAIESLGICIRNSISLQVSVFLLPAAISVVIGSRPIIKGELYARIKAEDSMWYIEGSVLLLTLLKVHRRGNYQDGGNNAGTFWKSVLRSQPGAESLQVCASEVWIGPVMYQQILAAL